MSLIKIKDSNVSTKEIDQILDMFNTKVNYLKRYDDKFQNENSFKEGMLIKQIQDIVSTTKSDQTLGIFRKTDNELKEDVQKLQNENLDKDNILIELKEMVSTLKR